MKQYLPLSPGGSRKLMVNYRVLVMMGGLVGGTAAQQELRQLCYLQSPSQRDIRKVESEVGRSVKDDAKHGARAGG